MNTAIAAMMTMVNEFYANGCSKGDLEALLPAAQPLRPPHGGGDVGEHGLCRQVRQDVPCRCLARATTRAKTVDAHVEMAVQVNGKLQGHRHRPHGQRRGRPWWPPLWRSDKVKKATEGMSVVKTILVKNKLVNLIVKPAK